MKQYIVRILFYSFAYLLFSAVITDAEYIEGIDTTDSGGFGLDSSFNVSYYPTGNNLIRYNGTGYSFGYLNCSFNDLKKVPDTIRSNSEDNDIFSPFIVKDKKDGTYLKVQIIDVKSGYIYRYGKNTTSNNKMFINTGYDRSLKYKPNNLYNWSRPPFDEGDTLYWEPPIQNNNHLIGYILYVSKAGEYIDKTKPINITQWDSIAFVPSMTNKTAIDLVPLEKRYINLVAVYQEGRSDFLDGWTMINLHPNGVLRPGYGSVNMQKKLSITPASNGLFITVPFLSPADPFSVTIYNPNGTIHSRISGIKGASAFLSTQGNDFTEGLYLLRAEFQDRSVVTQPFTIVR